MLADIGCGLEIEDSKRRIGKKSDGKNCDGRKNNNNNNKKQQKISLIWTYNSRRRILGCYTDILKITEDMFWKLFR